MILPQQLLADLVEFAPDAMLIVDGSGQILYANQRVTDLFGYPREELIKARLLADQTREEADRANLSKSRFLATASHDLRQPLQALSMLHGTLCRIDMHPNGREVLAQQAQAIDSMKRLLSALLDISKLESGAVKPEPSEFPLQQLFELLNTEFAPAAQSKGLTLAVASTDIHTHTDHSLLEQLLRNLISNAIKYTRAGTVTLRATPTASGVRVEVHDTGVGIPEDQLAFIFDEFFQVGVARNTTREGYGLGLAIVQRIAKLLDFRVQVQSQVGKGSIFMLELPRVSVQLPDCSSDISASGNLVRHAQSGKMSA